VQDARKYYDIVVTKAGYPEHTCDRTMTALGLLLNGELPTPNLVAALRMPCDPERWSYMAAAEYSGALFFGMDNALGVHSDSLRYLADQLGEFIEFAETNVPGIKYDEDKLVELLHMDREAFDLMRRTYELRKRVPCPLSPKDAFRLALLPSWYSNPVKALGYQRAYTDELFERAELGVGGVGEEKLRVAWLATGPFGGPTFDLLAEKGVSIPWFHYGIAARSFGVVHDAYFEEGFYGRGLSPLEEMARFPNYNAWGDLADKWIDPLIQVCRDLHIDAVIDFLQPGCVVTKCLRQVTSERVKNELGIPVLDLEGREFFDSPAARAEMDRKLETFLDSCIQNR
jgi:benzoyl-CoA reductase/2-hydroxyglutaryl-CoA dehydratase subunit BcrC/BadD/HgdB